MTNTPQEPQGSPDAAPQGAPNDTTPQGGTPQPQGAAREPLPDPAEDWQAQARKWEQRAKKDAKELAELKQRMQGLLTPEQVQDQAQAAAAAAEQATAASREALRLRVALEQGLPPDLADRLIGDDRDALEKDAAKLKALVATQTTGTSRIPDAGAGTGKTPTNQKPDANTLLRTLAGIG